MSKLWQRWAAHWQHPALRDRPALVYQERSISFAEMVSTVEAVQLPAAGAWPALLTEPAEPWNALALLVFLREARSFAPVSAENRHLLPVYKNLLPGSDTWGVSEEGVFKITAAAPGRDTPPSQLLRKLAGGHAGLILFTSGTTGTPKGVLHDLEEYGQSYTCKVADNQPTLLLLGADHIGGVDVLLRAWLRGSTVVLTGAERSPGHVARLIEKHRVQVLPATPSFLNLLLLSEATGEYDLSPLKTIAYGAERMPAALLHRLQQRLPGVTLRQKFGTTETGSLAVEDTPGRELFLRPAAGQSESMRVVDGELWLRAPRSLLGYLGGGAGDHSRLTEDGWYRTGDRAETGTDGSFRITGRTGELIKVGGEQIAFGEVENCILQLPQVAACRVEAEPNAILGQTLVAKVQPCDPAVPLASLTRPIREHCRKHLPAACVPVKILPLPPPGPRLKQG